MSNTLIIYGTTTGNTEMLAGKIASVLKSVGVETTLENVIDVAVRELLEYDVILFGSPTWEDGELQDDFADFYSDLERMDLKGKKAAVLGPGDSSYEHFCESVNIIEEGLRKCGAELILDGLKIDGDVDESDKMVEDWTQQLTEYISS
jgi:flavodoxin I